MKRKKERAENIQNSAKDEKMDESIIDSSLVKGLSVKPEQYTVSDLQMFDKQ